MTLFGGVHRGFAPPGPGSTEETVAERSIAYELGARVRQGSVRADVVGFASRYDSLLGRDTLSSGGEGTGELFNAGRALVWGIEASATWDLAARWVASELHLPVRLVYRLTSSQFREAFDSPFEPWGRVLVGDEFPYTPRHQVFADVRADYGDFGAAVEAVYVSRMRTSSSISLANGDCGLTSAWSDRCRPSLTATMPSPGIRPACDPAPRGRCSLD